MSETADWHIVYSNTAELISCTSQERHNLWGFITAGHCTDNMRGNLVRDFNGNILGTVYEEKYDWGTLCDCAFIAVQDPSLIDNKIFAKFINSTTPNQIITKTTPASQQQNDRIVKSGQVVVHLE